MTRKQKNKAFWILAFSVGLFPLVAQGGGGGVCGVDMVCSASDEQTPEARAIIEEQQKRAARKAVHHKKKAPKKVAKVVHASADSNTAAPAAAPAPAAPSYHGTRHELLVEEAKSVFINFDTRRNGPNPESQAQLIGKIYDDCKDYYSITFDPQPKCAEDTSAAAFQVVDLGGGKECMAAHEKKKDNCGTQPCTFLSKLTNATADLKSIDTVEVMMVHHDPNANEIHAATCEHLPTKIFHVSQDTIDADKRAIEAKDHEARLKLAENQIRSCRHTAEEVSVAKQACVMVMALDSTKYSSAEECVKSLNADGIEFKELAKRASSAKLDELPEVADKLVDWANDHPRLCKKIVEPLHTIAKRLATQKVKRRKNDDEDDRDPIEGYDQAIDVVTSAADRADCLRDTDKDKLSQMADNLVANRTEKVCEINGGYSAECQTELSALAENTMDAVNDACSGWEMNPTCMYQLATMQNLNAIPAMVAASDQRKMQSQMALRQMMSQFGATAGYGASGAMGANPMIPGAVGGYYGGRSSNSFGFGAL
jgi:hypothetical protein